MKNPTVQPIIQYGVAQRPYPGQLVSGDAHFVKFLLDSVFIAVLDGLGHGIEAAEAAKAALLVLDQYNGGSLLPLVKECHLSLKRTRGVAMSLAMFNSKSRTLTWTGVGNVDGVLLRADEKSRESLLLRNGVVGYQLPPLKESVLQINQSDTLILTTDGVHRHYYNSLTLSELPQQTADQILIKGAIDNDDALVLVARYLGGNHERL